MLALHHLAILAFSSLVAGENSYVGPFKFRMSDPRLPSMNLVSANYSVMVDLDKLSDACAQSDIRRFPPVDNSTFQQQYDAIEECVNQNFAPLNKSDTGNDDDKDIHDMGQIAYKYLLSTLNATRTQSEKWKHGSTIIGVFSDILSNMTNLIIPLSISGATTGVGWNVSCAAEINDILEQQEEWEKAGSAAATTLMALVPTLLAFGNLYVPRSSEAFSTSTWVGLSSAFYSFGLPTKSISAVPKKNIISLATFSLEKLELLESYSEGVSNVGELQSHTILSSQHSLVLKDFARIATAARNWPDRWHLWHLPALAIFVGEIIMSYMAVWPLFLSFGVPNWIFGCEPLDSSWTGFYLICSAVANAVFRLWMWLVGYHEVVEVFDLANNAQVHLTSVIEAERLKNVRIVTTAHEMPPMYSPIQSKLMYIVDRVLAATTRGKYGASYEHEKNEHDIRLRHSMSLLRQAWARIVYVAMHPIETLLSGLVGQSTSEKSFDSIKKRHPGACRYRPVIVLLHLSVEARSFIMTLFSGFIESSLLLVLTFFFAAQWGGNLVITCYAIALLLVFVTIGRAVSLLYIRWSAKVYGLHVIECETHQQIEGSLRIIASMKGALVKFNGATYFDGIRLDKLEGYREWLIRYERGEFDSDDGSPIATHRGSRSLASLPLKSCQASLYTPSTPGVELRTMSFESSPNLGEPDLQIHASEPRMPFIRQQSSDHASTAQLHREPLSRREHSRRPEASGTSKVIGKTSQTSLEL